MLGPSLRMKKKIEYPPPPPDGTHLGNPYRLGMVIKNILLEGLNWFHSANLTLSSDVDQGFA